MDYKKNSKSKLWNRFLVQILTVMMVVSMMPSYTFAYYAATDETGTVAEEQADKSADQADKKDQGDSEAKPDAQENKEEPEKPAVQPEPQENKDDKEDSAAPAADQKQEDGDQQKEDAGDAKPAAEDAKKDAGAPPAVSNDTAEPKALDEVKEDAKKAGTKAPAVSPEEQAEINYGPNGQARTFTVSLKDNKDKARAGDEITYNVDVNMWPAATYPYDGQNQEVMFEEWENITITVKMPEHVIITSATPGTVASFTQTDPATNTWTINLVKDHRDATNSNSINFDINTRITGNGELPDGTVLGEADITVSADFNVRINEDGTTRKYSKTVTDKTEEIPLSSPDEWVLTKSSFAEPNNYTIDKDHNTVTVHYLVKYGLGIEDSSGKMVITEDPSIYTRTGRAPFKQDISLTDTPDLTLHDGTKLPAQSMTVTPAHTGYQYKDGSSADEGGKPKAIPVQSGRPVDLPYAVVGTNTKFVAENTPAFSEYKVDMVYQLDKFMVWYYENASKTDADSSNVANIEYQILGRNQPEDTEDDASTTIPGYIKPGYITIEKYIVSYDNKTKNLYTKTTSLINGPATYEVYESDGTTLARIYYKDSAGKYQPITGSTVTIDPDAQASETNGKNGKIGFYLDAGTYVIKEAGKPSNTAVVGSDSQTKTVNEDGKITASFENKEQLGQIKIKKTDDTNNHRPVANVVFGLYKDREHTIPVKDENGNDYKVTTNSNTDYNAVFTRLVPGKYYVWEISAPTGYIKYDQAVEVDVTAGNTTADAVSIENYKNKIEIHLQKQYSTVADPTTFKDVTGDYAKFNKAFTLERRTSGTDWQPIKTDVSIDNKGASTIEVDRLDANGNKYEYRFVENIPEGYYNIDGTDSRTATSYSITPANATATDPQDKIIMKNLRGGFIELTKKKVTVNDSPGAYTAANQSGKTFKLYRVADGQTAAEYVAEATTGSNGKLRYSDLISVNGSGKTYTYYVVEQGTETGFTWITDSSIRIDGQNTPALKVGSFTTDTGDLLTPTSYNIQQKIVIGIRKIDRYNTDTQLAGAKFEVSDGTKTTTVTSDGSKYANLEVKLGKEYTITETSVPTGYYRDAAPQSIDTTGWKVGVKSDGTFAVFKADDTEVSPDDLKFTFADTPYKKIRLTKKVKNENTPDKDASPLANVTFTVYVKDGDNFVSYPVDGTPITIKGDGNTPVSLPDGTYYLHEDTKVNNVVYPDTNPGVYSGKGVYKDNQFYFGPYTVTKPAASGDVMWDIGIINIYNTGNLTVKKHLYDKNNNLITEESPADKTRALNGFTMQVFKADAQGNPTGDPLQDKDAVTGATGTDGLATFTNLPVYDDSGAPIRYVVVEKYIDDQPDLYYTDNFTSDGSPADMILGGTAEAGVVTNHTYMSVDVVKKYYDAREYELTGLKYELQGAVIALYKNNGDGTYTYIRSGTTDSKGYVQFGTLKFSTAGYVAIEYSVPADYKYMVPVDGKYLKDYAGGTTPAELTEADVQQLSRAELTSATNYTGEIDNETPWTQIHVFKKDRDNPEKLLDGANFTLYKQVLQEGTTGGQLTFDASNCTVVGEYTSGTWIFNDQPQTGEFQTDVLEIADNIVYWLVETKAPSGYAIIPSENYVLFPKEGTTYTNNSNNGQSTKVYPGGLIKNKINQYTVLDRPTSGPGVSTENWAYIEFTKWMQKESTAGKDPLERTDFVLMPNATFKLYAVNASDHNKVLLLDTITTGDENQVDGSPTTGYGVSRSMDAWAIFDEIERRFPDQLKDIITYHSAPDSGYDVDYPYVVGPDGKPVTDAQGNRTRIKGTFHLNAVLVEESGSSKYSLDLHNHNLQIEFIPSDLYLGNSKYAVTVITDTSADFCDQNEERRSSYTENTPKSMAIVDYLTTDNSVTLRHFGYDPELAGYELLHSDLETLHDDNPSLFISKQVVFELEKFNPATNKWEYWNPAENKSANKAGSAFKTDGNGYHFAKGLDPGEYRVVMKTPAAGYENFYPNTNTAFHFTVVVSDRTQTFTTYSPSKARMSIEKTDMSGNTIAQAAQAATFRLQSKSGTSYNKTASTSSGKAVFTELPADTTFTLAETAAPSEFTNEYFALLFAAQNPDYAALVNGTGYPVSYETTTKPSGESSQDGSKLHEKVIVKKEYSKAFSFKAPNVHNVQVKLIKKDRQNDQTDPKKLAGAQFKLYYHAFDRVSGTYTVPEFSESDPKWVNVGTVTTTEDGMITKAGLKPGVYYAVETKAPDHYDLDTKGQMIVMTGGLNLTIADSDKYKINKASGGTGELEFKDTPKVPLTVDKTVEFGDVPAKNYSFTFNLTDSEGKTITGNPATATGTATGGTITDKTTALFEDLSQGIDEDEIYYLTETAQTGYKLKEVSVGGSPVTADEKGRYPIKIKYPSTGVTVSVTNTYLEARVTIFKYDGLTGTGLTDASFEVLREDKKTPVAGATVQDNSKTGGVAGSYTAIIPFEDTTAETFYIHETKAPEIAGKQYTIDDGNAYIEVPSLRPGENRQYRFDGTDATTNQYALPNFEGITVKILKYGGIPGNETVPLAGAKFQMYFSTDGGTKWNTWHPVETTDSQGTAEFMILKGYDYAIAETNDVLGYVGLYGVYNGDTKLPTTTSDDGRTLYILGHDFNNGTEYSFTGYNIPYLKLNVVKEDISGKVTNPNASFHIYEVPADTPETLTDAQIKAIADAATTDNSISGETVNSKYTNEEYIYPGKKYLAVEDRAFDSADNAVNYSIIKDDSRVVYYKVFAVPEEGYEKEYTVTFKNNMGDAEVELEKTVDKDHVDSLTVKQAELTYTVKPTTTNGYALDSYRLNDSGLTPEPADATLADEWYDITEVIVGQGSMDKFLVGADPDKDYIIYATVTFVGFDGTEYKEDTVPINVSQGNISVKPTKAQGKKIKSFYIDYNSPELKTDTGYALGQNFVAGETKVLATVFKQVKPETGVVNAVKKITNNADVRLTFTPWSSTGEKLDQDERKDKDDAVTIVDAAKAPKVKFSKDGPPTDVSVDIGSTITYKLKIKNVTGEPIDFTDPIIVDLLPQGMVIDQASDFVRVTDRPGTIAEKPTVTTGFAGDSEYVNIAFTGTIGDGESLEVELSAVVSTAVTNYGHQMRNFAFTTSKEVGVATSDNTTGAVIKDDEGMWASELVSIATELTCDEDRAKALKDALGTQGTYGYLGDWHENQWVTDNQLVCVKAEYGPSDGGVYRTDKVAVLVNDETDVTQRTMHYQLTINNLSPNKRTNLAVMDIMPVVGDNRINNTPRGSNWDLYFDAIEAVRVNGQPCSDYTVYYYSGDATAFGADDITNIVNASKSGCPTGWSTDKPDKPTAFIVAFDYDPENETEVSNADTVVLEGEKNLQIEYTAKTDYREAEPLAEIVFTNAANDFNFGYSTFAPPTKANMATPNDPLGSNVVEVTIAPPMVKVGGDVWIDADSNGVQDDGKQSWYLNYGIVKQLIKDLGVKLNISNQRNLTVTETRDGTIDETGNDTNTDDKYGIAHFEFDELTSAKIRKGSTATNKEWLDANGGASNLIGKNPYTYNMNMNYKGSTFTKTKNVVSPRGSYVPGSIPDEDRTDDNFENRRGDYQTEQFFLHQTADVFDMTKDNGYNLLKTLELTKVNRATEEPIEGAEFKLYGPFEHDYNVTEADLTEENLVDTLMTGTDGKVSKSGLFFFKKYAIVESKPADGYNIEGAKAVGNITKLDEGKWILNVPAYDTVPPEDCEYTETVKVLDPKMVEVAVEKKWNDNDDAYGKRPKSIKVMLYTDEACTKEAVYADGKTVEEKTLTEPDWKDKWEKLPRYKVEKNLIGQETETEITYYVKETDAQGHELQGYDAVFVKSKDEVTGNTSWTITNTPITTGLEVKKEWEDTDDVAARVTAVTFRVEQSPDGETWTPAKLNGQEIILTIGRTAGEKMSTTEIDGLPAYDEDNNPLKYRAVEISITVDGQTLEVKDGKVGCYEVTSTYTFVEDNSVDSAKMTDLSEIKNTMVPTEFTVEKTFVDDTFNINKDIKSIKVKLQRKSGGGDWTDVEDYDLTQSDNWKHTWKGLPKYDMVGNAYDYRAIEVSYTTKTGVVVNVSYTGTDKTAGTVGAYEYTAQVKGTADDGFTSYIENKLVKGALEVSKEWENSDRAKVPGSITIKLKATVNGKEISISGVKKSTKLSKSNDWTDDTTWAELPVYDAEGNKISYELTESGKGKYKAEYEVYYNGSVVKDGKGQTMTFKIYPKETVEATFINTLRPPTKTGDELPLAPYMGLGLASLTGLLYLIYRRRRTN